MRCAWLFAAAALLAGAARAAPLTFDAAMKLAADGPGPQAKAMDVEAARSAAVSAGRLPDPKLRLGVENFPVSGPPAWRFGADSMTMATVGVMQEAPSGAKRRAARTRAQADIGAAEAAGRIEARNVALNAGLAWIDLYYAKRRLTALDEIEQAIAPVRETAPSQLAAGSQRPAQVLEADQLAAALGDRRAELAAAVGKARAELARWTGDAGADVSGEPRPFEVDGASLRAGLDRVPSLAAYEAIGRQADADVAAARADKRPDWSWELTYQHRDPMWGEMVSVGATVSLPLFGRTRQDPVIAARTLTANRVRVEREAARRALAAQLDADLAEHAMHHDRLHRAQTALVPLAKRRADLEIASYGAGSASLPEVLQALLSLAEARIDALDREAEVSRDAVRIVLTYGADAR